MHHVGPLDCERVTRSANTNGAGSCGAGRPRHCDLFLASHNRRPDPADSMDLLAPKRVGGPYVTVRLGNRGSRDVIRDYSESPIGFIKSGCIPI